MSFMAIVHKAVLHYSGPQPFWHQGLVLWKTGVGQWGWRARLERRQEAELR